MTSQIALDPTIQYSRRDHNPVYRRWIVAACVAGIPVALIVSLFAQWAASGLPGKSISSFRAGSLALTDETKSGDIVFAVTFYVVLAVMALVFGRTWTKLSPSRDMKAFVLLELVIAAPLVLKSILGGSTPLLGIFDSVLLLTLLLQLAPAVFFVTHHTLARRSPTFRIDSVWFAPVLLLAATTPVAALGAVTVVRLAFVPEDISSAVLASLVLVLTMSMSAAIGSVGGITRVRKTTTLAVGFAAVGILSVPLILPPLVIVDGVITQFMPGSDTRVWAIAASTIGLLLVVETLARYRYRRERGILFVIPSFSVAAALVPLRINFALPSISADDYHFGEALSPFFLLLHHGQLPYTDLALPRGILLNLIPGGLNVLLNDGSAASLRFVAPIVAILITAVAHLLLRNAVGFYAATAIVALTAVSNRYVEGDLIVAATIIWLLSFAIRKPRPIWTGLIVIFANVIAILAYPMMGIVSTAVTGAVLVFAFVGAMLSRLASDIRYAIVALISAVVTASAIFLSPLGRYLWAAIHYVVANGASNTEAFGVALARTWRTPFSVGHIVSLAFVLGLLASVWLLWRHREAFRSPSWAAYLRIGLATVPGIFVAILAGRYLGRVDPAGWSYRPAEGTLVVLGIILPAILLLLSGKHARMFAWSSLAVAGCVSAMIVPVGQGGLIKSSLGMLNAPGSWTSEEYVSAVPRLGVGQGSIEHLKSISELDSITSGLPPEEAVLNLSNRGALFGYLGWRNPMTYLAPYNIESAAAEEEVVAKLGDELPRYAFIGPGPQHDGLSLTLRNPQLAKWVMDNYAPVRCGSTIWAVIDNGTQTTTGDLNCKQDASEIDDDSILWAEGIGAPVDLQMIPTSWGRRAQPFADAGTFPLRVNKLSSGTPGAQEFGINVPVSTGLKGMLLLSAKCDGFSLDLAGSERIPARAKLAWESDGVPESLRQSIFGWTAGELLVPLDAYPSWVAMQEQSNSLALTVPSAGCSTGWAVTAEMVERPH